MTKKWCGSTWICQRNPIRRWNFMVLLCEVSLIIQDIHCLLREVMIVVSLFVMEWFTSKTRWISKKIWTQLFLKKKLIQLFDIWILIIQLIIFSAIYSKIHWSFLWRDWITTKRSTIMESLKLCSIQHSLGSFRLDLTTRFDCILKWKSKGKLFKKQIFLWNRK